MTDNDEIIEVVKLKIQDPVVQKEVAEWIIENMQQIEFPSSNTLERLIQVVEQIRCHKPKNWKQDCFESFVTMAKL
ncbi:hypothetical protein OAC06_08335 [Alphaproteobacteria bacterium]|nr:hypothetical protein [Alphaproteobacteria bacterium]